MGNVGFINLPAEEKRRDGVALFGGNHSSQLIVFHIDRPKRTEAKTRPDLAIHTSVKFGQTTVLNLSLYPPGVESTFDKRGYDVQAIYFSVKTCD